MARKTHRKLLQESIRYIHESIILYLQEIQKTKTTFAGLVVFPLNKAAAQCDTQQVLEEISLQAKPLFVNNQPDIFSKIFTPLPNFMLKDTPESGMEEFTYQILEPKFDDEWFVDQFAKALLTCPGPQELKAAAWHESYESQVDSMRFLPLIDAHIRSEAARLECKKYLSNLSQNDFELFVNDLHARNKTTVSSTKMVARITNKITPTMTISEVYDKCHQLIQGGLSDDEREIAKEYQKHIETECETIACSLNVP